jgi:hypothetical protein
MTAAQLTIGTAWYGRVVPPGAAVPDPEASVPPQTPPPVRANRLAQEGVRR